MRGKTKRVAMMLAMLVAVLGMQMTPFAGILLSYGAEEYPAGNYLLEYESLGTDQAMPGEQGVSIAYSIKNTGKDSLKFDKVALRFDSSSDLTISGGNSKGPLVGGGDPVEVSFSVDIAERAKTGARSYNLIFIWTDGGKTYEYKGRSFQLNIDEGVAPSSGSNYVGAVDFTHKITPEGGFNVGEGNSISFEAFNKGNTTIRNGEMSITLPEGMSISNGSNMQSVGYMDIGDRKTRSFSIYVEDTLGGKSYPITVKMTGIDMSSKQFTSEKTFYITVTGDGSSTSKNLSIENISVPSEVAADQDFTLAFNVKNNGTSTIKNMKVSAELPEGLLNKTTNTFVLNEISAGESVGYSVTLFSQKGSNTSYPVKISVVPLSGETGSNVMQYVSVFVKSGLGDAKTPQLMVDQYTYGGSYVMAGKEFNLDIGLFNTSDKTLSNIKVTISSSDGTFVPAGGSNSFFVDTIDAKGHFTKALLLSSKPEAKQETTPLTIAMSYEDGDGNEFKSEDTISIPVVQEMRLSVDKITPPYECYAGQPSGAEVQFYNMGKTTLNNLKVTAEGDFDVMESNSYFVGNMQGGSSDKFSFTFIPRQVGPVEGKVIFTYEDAGGQTQSYEEVFSFNAMEMPVWEEPGMEEPEQKKVPWALIIFGIAAAVLIIGTIVFVKVRKRRLNKKLEIQDAEFYAAMDLDKTGDISVTKEVQPEEPKETAGASKSESRE